MQPNASHIRWHYAWCTGTTVAILLICLFLAHITYVSFPYKTQKVFLKKNNKIIIIINRKNKKIINNKKS